MPPKTRNLKPETRNCFHKFETVFKNLKLQTAFNDNKRFGDIPRSFKELQIENGLEPCRRIFSALCFQQAWPFASWRRCASARRSRTLLFLAAPALPDGNYSRGCLSARTHPGF